LLLQKRKETVLTKAALPIRGYKGRQVSNVFYRQEVRTDNIFVLFGGWRYNTDMPLLYYTRKIAFGLGADVLCLDVPYSVDRRYAKQSDQERQRWYLSDVSAAFGVITDRNQYRRVTLVGKSLGTLATAHLLIEGALGESTNLVWISPLLEMESVRSAIAGCSVPSLLVVGSLDESFSEANISEIRRNSSLQLMVIEHGDGDLEAPGDVARSTEIASAYVRRLKSFLGLAKETSFSAPTGTATGRS
jgi:predicted alpha/beta-hydrolase family hydrolase